MILKCIIILYNYSKKTMLYVLLWVFNLFMHYNWAFLCVSYSRSFSGIFKGMMINTIEVDGAICDDAAVCENNYCINYL